MRILMVIDTIRSGGKERRMIELLKGLVDKKIEISVLVLSNLIEYNEIYNLPVQLITLERSVKWDITIFPKMYHHIQEFRPDIIHVWEIMASFYVAPLARLSGIKLVSAIITDVPVDLSRYGKKSLLSRYSFHLANKIIGNSKAGIRAYNAPPHKSLCIYNGIDLNRVQNLAAPCAIRKSLNIPENQIVIAMVASFSELKDYKTFILAASQLSSKYKYVTFICIGDGPNLPEMKELTQSTSSDIRFTGRIQDVESVINATDIGVLATFTEGISNAIIEFMILGKPVVATDGGGTAELICDNETGFLVKEKSISDLAGKIEQLINDPHLRKSMGEKGRRRISEHFNLSKMTENYYSLYLNLLEHV